MVVDTEKNINFAQQKMGEQKQEFMQAVEYNNRINQLEIYDELLQSQENLPIIQISKMKRGKGIKSELKQLIAKEFHGQRGEVPLSEFFELELLAVLRKKPYEKKKSDTDYVYRIESQSDKFPSLSDMLKMMAQIISSKRDKIKVSIIREKVPKKMKKFYQLKPQNLEIQKLEKLSQIVQNKHLKMF